LIRQLYSNDEGIKETVDGYILKTVARYDSEPVPSIKRELKKNKLFLEEYAKLLDYISSSFNGKTARILELQNSMKISKMF
jgi:hypothetical protein